MGTVTCRAVPDCTRSIFSCLSVEREKTNTRKKRFWDYSSPETAEQQRLRLIHQFLNLDEINRDWDPTDHTWGDLDETSRIPTTEEIDIILRPWQPDHIRMKAWQIWGADNSQPIMLRTHYDPKNDEVVLQWPELSEEFGDGAWWAILNDPELFNFGVQWWLVFDLLPEAAGPTQEYSRLPSPELTRSYGESLREYLQVVKRTEPNRWRENRDQCIETAASDLLRSISETYILVADRETIETDKLRLVYIDGKRNVVQETRIDFDGQTLDVIIIEWYKLSLPHTLWEEGTIGEEYRGNGELGKKLYQLDEADLALELNYPLINNLQA